MVSQLVQGSLTVTADIGPLSRRVSVSPRPGVRAGELLGDGVSMLLLYPGVNPTISELTFLLWLGVGFRMMLGLGDVGGAVES
jgi:hypothetical protein